TPIGRITFRTEAAIERATAGNTIPSIAAAHPMRTKQPRTSSAVQLAGIPCPAARRTHARIKASWVGGSRGEPWIAVAADNSLPSAIAPGVVATAWERIAVEQVAIV